MAKKESVARVVVKQPEPPIGVEVIASAIAEIGAAMKKIRETRLTRGAIVALIADRSKLGKGTIEIVLNNLDELEKDWLKPVKIVGVLAFLVSSSACASKYSVSPKTDAMNNEFALSGQPLMSVTPKGRFIWRKKPEEVAVMLMTYAGNLEHNLKLCQDQLPKSKPAAKPAAAPAAKAPGKAPAK